MSAAIPPNNIIMLGVLGIGAFYLVRRAHAANTAVTPARPAGSLNPGTDPMAVAFAAFGKMFGSGAPASLLGTSDGRAQTAWSPVANPGANNPSAYVSGGADGISVNTPNVAPFDALNPDYLSA